MQFDTEKVRVSSINELEKRCLERMLFLKSEDFNLQLKNTVIAGFCNILPNRVLAILANTLIKAVLNEYNTFILPEIKKYRET